MSEEADVEKELRALEARLDAGRMNGDLALFDEVLATGFETTNPVGAVTGKEQVLADIRSGAMKVRSSQSVDITIKPIADGAIVRGKAIMKATYRGIGISGVYAYTHVYVRKEGRWQVLAAHTSRRMPDGIFLLLTLFLNLFHIGRK